MTSYNGGKLGYSVGHLTSQPRDAACPTRDTHGEAHGSSSKAIGACLAVGGRRGKSYIKSGVRDELNLYTGKCEMLWEITKGEKIPYLLQVMTL